MVETYTLAEVMQILQNETDGARKFVCPGMEGYLFLQNGKIRRHVADYATVSFKEHDLPIAGYVEFAP